MLLKVYKSRVWIILFMLLPFVGQAQLPPGLPAGWEFTLNPTSATYAIPTDVMFDNVDPLQAGDWVGVFFEDDGVLHCAGAVEWTGTANLALVAFGNDDLEPVKNGFAENELVQWKFYRDATAEEVEVFSDPELFWTNGDLDVVSSFFVPDEGCEQMFSFTAGYNWLSFNVLPESSTALNDVLGIVGYTAGDFIQTPGGTAEFFDGFGWFGTLANINADRMYQLNVASANDLTVAGLCVDVSVPINLSSGWNWIGYKPQNSTDINTALASMTPTAGDFIQTVGGTAEFFDGFGWFGTLANMAPGKGYQINLANADALVYPEVDNSMATMEANNSTFATAKTGRENPNWPTPPVFPNYQTVYYRVLLNGVSIETEGSLLSAWKDDEIRGLQGILMAPPIPGAQNTYPLQMGSELTFEPGFTFKFYDVGTDQVYDIVETHDFEALNNLGTIFDPIELNCIVPAGTIDICGTVTDAQTGTGIEGALITATGSGGGEPGNPDWPTPVVFPNYQTIYYMPHLDGVAIDQEGSILSVWKDGEIRGIQGVLLPPPIPGAQRTYPLQMGSELTFEPGFTFKVYDVVTDMVYDIEETHDFEALNNQGTIFSPIPLTAIAGGGETYTALTAADGSYCIVDVASGTYTISAEAEGYLPEEVSDVLVEESITQDFALTPEITCEDAIITNFPNFLDNACAGDAYVVDFTGVLVENAIDEIWTVDPMAAGTISEGFFSLDPDFAGGMVTISLLAVAEEPCEDAYAEVSFEVFALPEVTCPEDFAVCLNDEPWDLYGVNPTGGTFEGIGVVDGTSYDPALAGVGSWEITYTYVDVETGCENSCAFIITVNPLPEFDCPEYGPFCEGDENIIFMEDGEFFFDGSPITGWNPSMAGTFEITYVYTDPVTGCSDECMFEIVVNDLPEVTCPEDFSVSLADLPLMLTGAMPEGGTYSGAGVVDGMFDVDMEGDYEITYTYTDMNGCTNFCMFTISVVVGEPELVFGNLQWPPEATICEGETFTAYAQVVIENGILGENGYEGLTVEIGINSDDTDPGSWTNWYPADYFGLGGFTERPEYGADLGDDLDEGSYYYASRFTFMDEVFYGGFDGGFWNGVDNVSGELTVIDCSIPEIVWANVQWPPDGEITFGDDFDVYAQVYIPTITGIDPPNADIQAWIGFSTDDVNPELFTQWVPATFNVFAGNNNEYVGNIGAEVPGPGTYYYASRFQYAGGDFVYGGFNGGFWDGINNVSGILTVLDPVQPCEDAEIVGFPEGEALCEGATTIDFGGVVVNNAIEEIWSVVPETAGFFDGDIFNIDPDFIGEFTISLLAVAEEPCEDAYAEALYEIIALPVVECPEDQTLCFNDEPFVFGDFVFDPADYEPGVYEFTFTESNECGVAECTFFIEVIGLPVIECPEDIEVCLNADPFEYGGEMIDPMALGVGVHEFILTASNNCGTVECSFFVTVLPLPVIVEQPEDVEVLYGMDAEFTVVAENADAYQWYFEGEMIPGANDATLTLMGVTLDDEGGYHVEITNECDPGNRLISMTAYLTVLPWTQEITLGGPVSGASTFLELTEDNVADIVSPLLANLQYVEFQRPNQVYVPNGTSFPWTEERGAKVGLSGGFPTSIEVMGYPTLGTEVDLPGGWSIMPVWSQDAVLAADVFGPLGEQLIAAFSIDYSGLYWPQFNVYSLEYLVPGSAYLIALTGPGTIDFDVPTVKATPGYVSIPANKTSWSDIQLTGVQHNIAITADALAQLQVGDVIGAFNQSGSISGMLEITSLKENAVLRVYGNEFTSRTVNGFAEGDVLTFKVYRNGDVIDLNVTFDEQMPNANVFAENGLSAIVDLKAGVTSVNDLTADLNVNLYPNPAKDFVNIETNFEIRNLKVVNYVGQVVFDRNIDQISYQINTANFGPGMYFVQIQTNDGVVITKRLTVN